MRRRPTAISGWARSSARFVSMAFGGTGTPPPGDPPPSSDISSLLAARDGTLCIGTFRGLAAWKDGKLTQYHDFDGQNVAALLEDREGTVWAGTWTPPRTGRLCGIHDGAVRCQGEDGSLGWGVLSLCEDSGGNLWAGAATGLWQWKPGPPKVFPLPEAARDIRKSTRR
jgi:ligand-binding sensor domain-containing protein